MANLTTGHRQIPQDSDPYRLLPSLRAGAKSRPKVKALLPAYTTKWSELLTVHLRRFPNVIGKAMPIPWGSAATDFPNLERGRRSLEVVNMGWAPCEQCEKQSATPQGLQAQRNGIQIAPSVPISRRKVSSLVAG